MKTKRIPKEQWERYFDALSNRLHVQAPKVNVTSESLELGDQAIAANMALRAIFYEEKGSEKGNVDIELGDDVSGNRVVQRIEADTVWVEEDASGQPLALDIEGVDRESQAKIKTIIQFLR